MIVTNPRKAPWLAAVGVLSGTTGAVVAVATESPPAVLLAAGGVAVLVVVARVWKAGRG